jgi:hypothetical protein
VLANIVFKTGDCGEATRADGVLRFGRLRVNKVVAVDLDVACKLHAAESARIDSGGCKPETTLIDVFSDFGFLGRAARRAPASSSSTPRPARSRAAARLHVA